MSEQHEHCIICESKDLSAVVGYERAHLVKCGQCGFVFAGHIPTTEELTKHYEGYGRDDFLSDITIKRYHELLDQFEPYRKTGKLFDVGSGIGYFLEVAKERGWEIYGNEFTEEAVEICTSKGASMHLGPLKTMPIEPGAFDVVTSFEVIEHTNDPHSDIEAILQMMREGGLFYCTTPNFAAMSRKLLKADWNIIAYPEHLSYYTPKTMKRLLKAYPFRVKKVQTTGFSRTRFKTSKGTSDQAYISETSDDEKLRQKIEGSGFLRFVKRMVNGLLSLFSKGDTLKIYAEKVKQ